MPSEPAAFGSFPPSRLQQAATAIGCRLPRNWLGRRLSGWLRALTQATASGPVDVGVLGVRMRLYLKDNASERRLLVTPQFFDPKDLEILASRVTTDFSFVDLGANVGTYSLFVASAAGPGARILAIEPHPVTAQRLRDNIALNGFGTSIKVAQYAVAERDGSLQLAADSNNLGATTVRLQKQVRGRRDMITVPVRTLHGLVAEHGFERIDALKLDIEGAEDRALRPFLATAPEALWPRLIVIEPNLTSWQGDLLAELEALGWRKLREFQTKNCVLERA